MCALGYSLWETAGPVGAILVPVVFTRTSDHPATTTGPMRATTQGKTTMATILKDGEFDFGTAGNRETKLPWKEWADGQTRRLCNPGDYTSKYVTISQQARKYAAANGLKALIKEDGENCCVLRFIPKPTTEPATTETPVADPVPETPVAPPVADKGKAKGKAK